MSSVLIRIVVAILFAGGAWYAWSEAGLADRRADARQQIVTLRYADVAPNVDAMTNATVAYWLGQYSSVKPDADGSATDAALLLTAANAAFRQAERNMTPGAAATTQQLVQTLDGVLQAYASALKAAPRQVEAAYNYEYVSRLRDQVARAQGKGAKPVPAPLVTTAAGDLPAGTTIHGRPGAPPPEAKMEDFQMLAPMEFGDRETQPEATPGVKRERKG